MKLIISLKSIKWIAQSTKKFRSYQFLSIDRYNRYQSKSDYRQLSIYRLVFRYRFLAGIKCFSKTGLCKRQLKRGLQSPVSERSLACKFKLTCSTPRACNSPTYNGHIYWKQTNGEPSSYSARRGTSV